MNCATGRPNLPLLLPTRLRTCCRFRFVFSLASAPLLLPFTHSSSQTMTTPFNRRPFTHYFIASPIAALLSPIHHLLSTLRGPPHLLLPGARPIRVVCISDTHTLTTNVPDGDLLIHAGDLSNYGNVREIQAAVDWLRGLPHPHKVVICGNHDSYFDVRSRRNEDRDQPFADVSASSASIRSLEDLDSPHRIDWGDIHYLQHTSVSINFPRTTPFTRGRSLTVYGAPQIPAVVPFGPEHAFTYPPLHDAWSGTVPINTDILVTHTPPQAHLDLSPVYSIGCPFLLAEAWRVRPTLHVCAHVHDAYGMEPVYWDEAQRAWERLCLSRRRRARSTRWQSLLDFLRDFFDVSGLVDAARVVVYGVLGVVWAKVWGGDNGASGWIVNAACMSEKTGTLDNPPQVVEL